MSQVFQNRKLETEIREQMRTLRKSIKSGDDSKLCVWIVPHELAASQRPLRDDPSFDHRYPLPPSAKKKIEKWVRRVRDEIGIRSVICLLTNYQLNKYYVKGGLALHPDGLLGYYDHEGLKVSSIETPDF